MAQIDEQLVQLIVEQVLSALRRTGSAAAQAPARSGAAEVHPPAGVCTGDYSQYAELKGKPVGAPLPARPTPVEASAQINANAAAALTGIVTAEQLERAVASSSNGVALLAHDARLTPLANDFVREHPKKMLRLDPTHPRPEFAIPVQGQLPWIWWADGFCSAVQDITARLRDRIQPSAAPRDAAGLAQIVQDLAASIRTRRAQGGVLFVRNAALALCYTNRCAALRAVIGTCDEAVDQGITELGANVMVIEYPHVGPKKMESMVQRMLRQSPNVPAHVQRQLTELHRCM
jgi:hypothetical protein